MEDFGFNEMQEIQKQLQEKYKDERLSLYPFRHTMSIRIKCSHG